jgi:acetolactate synthase-1/2/3 large subunit
VKDVHDIPSVIDEAFRVSTNGKPGAVHIDIPKCVLNNVYSKNYGAVKQYNAYEYPYVNNRVFVHSTLLRIMHLINIAKRPVIIAGQGCNHQDNIYKLRSFALRGNIPVTTTIHGLGIFDETHPLSLEFHGMHGNPAANYAIQDSDLIIALGSRFDDRTTGNIKKYAPEAFKAFERNEGGIVHVNVNSKEINSVSKTHYNYHMDCGTFLDSVTPFFRSRNDWIQKINTWKSKYPFKYSKGKDLMTQDVISEINQFLLNRDIKDYIITTGVGNHQMMACQYIKWRYPKSLITSGSLGVMGVGLPFAIGSQIAFPEKLVIDIDGDGSFNHTLSELKTVMNYKLPIKIAILNDTCFSMVNTWEKLFYEERYTATDLYQNPDYVKLADSYDIKSIYCNTKEDLKKNIEEFLSYDGAILCEFKVKSDQCYPLVPPGAALDDMILSNIDMSDDSGKIKKEMLAPC